MINALTQTKLHDVSTINYKKYKSVISDLYILKLLKLNWMNYAVRIIMVDMKDRYKSPYDLFCNDNLTKYYRLHFLVLLYVIYKAYTSNNTLRDNV